MKQEERTRITYEKILAGAIKEFGTKSYENASLNTICNENHIAKGLLYHNFKNKDDLYLQCVKICFHELVEYLRSVPFSEENTIDSFKNLFQHRQIFFEKNPYYENIFFYVLLHSPAHLQNELLKIRREFDEFCMIHYKKLVKNIPLRKNISEEVAVQYFILFQEMFNGYFQKNLQTYDNFHTVIQDHEMSLSQIFDIFLYGIAEKSTDCI